jgi:hypothetical protein
MLYIDSMIKELEFVNAIQKREKRFNEISAIRESLIEIILNL